MVAKYIRGTGGYIIVRGVDSMTSMRCRAERLGQQPDRPSFVRGVLAPAARACCRNHETSSRASACWSEPWHAAIPFVSVAHERANSLA